MTVSELLNAIESVKANKLENIKGRNYSVSSYSSFYIVINHDDQVTRTSSISFIYTIEWKYAILVVDYGYTVNSYNKNNWELIGFINRSAFISVIEGDKWHLDNINFGFTNWGYSSPSFIIKRKGNTNEEISYDASDYKFDHAWQFFKEIDKHCTTLEAAEIYKMYYKERLESERQSLTLKQYQNELAHKDSILSQYKELLDLIDKKVKA